MTEPIPTAVLMCHAPIVIPRIAGREASRIATTTETMREVASHVVEAAPDVVVIASPHAPRHERQWSVADDPRVEGTFARFGVPDVGAGVPFAAEAGEAIEARAAVRNLACARRRLGALDHGTLVPLWFLSEAGWNGPTVRLALPVRPDAEGCKTMGAVVRECAEQRNERWVMVASGDMSHRLLPDAPAGFDPRAQEFDDALVECVRQADYDAIPDLDPQLRERAAEDVVDTLEVAVGATAGQSRGHRVLSYEGPFGVGYLVAVLYRNAAKPNAVSALGLAFNLRGG